MKGKFSSMWRVVAALALVASFSLVMAVPASASVVGTVSLDKDYYNLTTNSVVTVTVTDADLDVPKTITDEKSTTPPTGAEATFVVEEAPIDIAAVTGVDDLVGTAYGVTEVENTTPPYSVTLDSAPPATAEFLAATSIGSDLSLVDQPAHATTLTATLDTAPTGAENVFVSITGTDAEGNPLSESSSITGAATIWTTINEFASVVAGGVDAGKSAGAASTEIAISADNAVYVDYRANYKNEVTVKAVSTADPDGINVTLTETELTSGIFGGDFTLIEGASDDDADQLHAADGDTITVSYEDVDPAATRTATAEVDTTVPTITVVSPEDESAINDDTPKVAALLADEKSGIDAETIVMKVDDIDTPAQVVTHTYLEGEVSFTPGAGLEYETLAEGIWYVSVDVKDVADNEAITKEWSFTVDTVDPTAPTGLTATAMPKRIDLTWSAATDETSGVAGYNVYRGTVTGSYGAEPINEELVTDPSYSDATGTSGTEYFYVVKAVDEATNEGLASNEDSDTFCAEYATQTFSTDLIGGWNYISPPIIPCDDDITAVLNSVDGKYIQVWAYPQQQWQVYIPGEPDEYYDITGRTKLENMVDGLGYIIDMTEPAAWTGTGMQEVPGVVVPPSYAVAKGWNLIGFKTMDFSDDGEIKQADDSMLASEYLATIDGTVVFLRYFDRSEVTFKELDLSSPMLICHGYWLYATAAGEIVPPIALP